MVLTQGEASGTPLLGNVPRFYYENIGFAITTTTAAVLATLDIRGVKFLSVVIENEGAKRIDLQLDFYADPDADANSYTKKSGAIAVAATSVVSRQVNVNSHTRATDPDATPAIVDALPASTLVVSVDSEDADSNTGNIWICGGYQ